MQKTLYIIRGLPGSGKSTLAAALVGREYHEADQYFMETGSYKFDPTKLKEAHQWCHHRVSAAMQFGVAKIAVSNTFTQPWELQPYLELAAEYGYEVSIITCENDFGSTHNVPPESINKMASRWEPMDHRIRSARGLEDVH